MNFNICIASLLVLTSVSVMAKYEYDGKNPPPVRKIEAQPARRPEPLRPAVLPDQANQEIISSTPSATRRSGTPHPNSQYTVLMNDGNGGAAPTAATARPKMTFCQFLDDLFHNKKQFRAIKGNVEVTTTRSANQNAGQQMGLGTNHFALWQLTELDSRTGDPRDNQVIYFDANSGFFHTLGNTFPGRNVAPLHLYSNPGNIEISDINMFRGNDNFQAEAEKTYQIICKHFGVTKL